MEKEKLQIFDEKINLEYIENKNQTFIFLKKLLLNIVLVPYFVLSVLFFGSGCGTGPR